ncbi:hypothetical protein D3C81_1984190 [compost metagenome]
MRLIRFPGNGIRLYGAGLRRVPEKNNPLYLQPLPIAKHVLVRSACIMIMHIRKSQTAIFLHQLI